MEDVGINPEVLRWFRDKRKISEKTLKQSKIYSESRRLNGDVIPRECIVFPYIFNGIAVNHKYRNGAKEFGQTPGGKQVLWNVDILSDPRLQKNEAPLIVCEGEIDALSFIQIGCPAVSVPNGASFPKGDELPEYLKSAWELLEPIKRIILATDGDKAGKPLAKYLAERLGEARCYVVEYPAECKDANDVLQKYGEEEVQRLVFEAKAYPISGLYSYCDLPDVPDIPAVTTGWGRLDPFLQLYHPSFLVLSGIPNSGKSKWINQLAAQVAILHGWNVALASLEGRVAYTTDSLKSVYRELFPKHDAEQWLNHHFQFILKDDTETDEFDLDWFLDKARVAVIRHGVKMFIIDPWNEVEHSLRKGETMTDYCGRAINQIKRFTKEYNVVAVVVAHLTKSGGNKAPDDINPYDIADSAHFFNKCDQCAIIYRIQGSNEANVLIRKIREQPDTGQLGKVPFTFDPNTDTFSQ